MKYYVRSSETVTDDEYSVFDPYNGKRYFVSGDGSSTIRCFNDPVAAIKHWFRIVGKSGLSASIMAKKRSDAIDICKAGTDELLTELYNKYRCPYKLQFLIDACKKQVADGCKYFYENEFGDQVHPFDVG